MAATTRSMMWFSCSNSSIGFVLFILVLLLDFQPCSWLRVPEWLRRSLRTAAPAHLDRKVRLQSDCVVVLCIVGAVHKCDSATAGGF